MSDLWFKLNDNLLNLSDSSDISVRGDLMLIFRSKGGK